MYLLLIGRDVPFTVRSTRLIHSQIRNENPDHVTVDETVIQLNDEQCWLYAAVDLATNESLYTKLNRPEQTPLS